MPVLLNRAAEPAGTLIQHIAQLPLRTVRAVLFFQFLFVVSASMLGRHDRRPLLNSIGTKPAGVDEGVNGGAGGGGSGGDGIE